MNCLFAHTAMPDMTIIVVLFAVIGVLAFLGVAFIAFNCYLALAAPRVGRTLLAVNYTLSVGLAALIFALGFNLGAGAPYEKNWWCLAGAAAVLLTSTVGCCRSVSRSVQPNRSRLWWAIGFAVAPLLLVLFLADLQDDFRTAMNVFRNDTGPDFPRRYPEHDLHDPSGARSRVQHVDRRRCVSSLICRSIYVSLGNGPV